MLQVVPSQDQIHLANIYKKKQAPVVHPVFFNKKTWAQIAGGSSFHAMLSVPSGIGSLLGAKLLVIASNSLDNSGLADCIAFLEHSVELLSDQLCEIGAIVISILYPLSIVISSSYSALNLDMVVDSVVVPFSPSSPVTGNVGPELSLSSSKILITKMGGLESKMMALEVSISSVLTRLDSLCSNLGLVATCNIKGINNSAKQEDIVCWHKNMNNLISIVTETKLKDKICPWIINKFSGVWVFTSGLDSGHMGSGVVIIINISLVQHVCKVSEVPGRLLSVKLLFKNKLSMSILGLYAVSFVVLSGDFNKDSVHKCASFKKCLDLGLVNSLLGSPVVKTIDYILVSSNLVNTVLECSIVDVSEYFDTDHQAIFVIVGLSGLLDVQLNSLHKQVNKNCWKFDFKDKFENATLVNAGMFSDEFAVTVKFSDLDAIIKALVVQDLIDSDAASNCVHSALSGIRKSYYASKLAESLVAKKANIRAAIDKRIESFEINKGHTIKNVLEYSFRTVVLDHLVVDNELILEPNSVRSKVDVIMEGWTRKRDVIANVSNVWFRQYWLLDYVFDKAFSGIMHSVELSKLLDVIFDLSDGKAAGFLDITNKLWKHCDKSILDILLVFLNFCLSCKLGVLMNICFIALIKTAHKILSKILSNKISLAYSIFNVLYRDNFSVLKGMTTQSPIFAVRSVVKDTLEKNQKLWLVLQNMWKAYNLKSLVRIKMYNRFIRFFGSIHKNCTNRVMTDFELMDGYCVHDSLDQGEVFSPLLCKVKRQESMCGYRLSSHFISKNGCAESQARLSSFFVAGVFVDDTIWVGSSWAATQHILDVASEFFQINDISINNNKTVAILINSKISNSSLSINGSPIFIAKKGESHQYLDIFPLTEGLLKPSLVKANLDVYFFTNLVLKKAVSDKQFFIL
ncbi:hypothetical protein G9A89_003051 [Geosiphon pyriformis]|nr:hypothetical protein G9A89_003051 [Geosiphon pyriformis]